jgi:hypothetical protein
MTLVKLDLKGRMARCADCALFVETQNGRGLCTAFSRSQKASDIRCSTHFKSSTKEKVPSKP